MGQNVKRVRGSKRLRALDVVIVIVFATCLIGALLVYVTNDTVRYSGEEAAYQQDGTNIWDMAYNFTTIGAFSANNPITIHVIVHYSPNFTQSNPAYVSTPTTIYVYFPAAIPPHLHYDKYGETQSVPLVLSDNASSGYTFSGSETFTFQSAYQACFTISTQFLQSVPDCNPSSQASMLSVAGASDFLQYQSNKITLTLTLVILAFTVIFIRAFFADIGENLYFLRHGQ